MDCYKETGMIWLYNYLRYIKWNKYGNDGEGWYFRFNYDNKIYFLDHRTPKVLVEHINESSYIL